MPEILPETWRKRKLGEKRGGNLAERMPVPPLLMTRTAYARMDMDPF